MANDVEDADRNKRLREEIKRARAAAGRKQRNPFGLEVATGEDGQVDHLYRAGQVLTSDADLPRVLEALRRRRVRHRVADALIGGVTLLEVGRSLPTLLDQLDQDLGVGVVTPNHVLDVQGHRNLCPATEPEPATVAERWPVERDAARGTGVRVAVVDTGFIPAYADDPDLPWLRNVERYDEDDEVYVGRGMRRKIAPYGGHGTFSAGVVLSMAPGATVTVDDVLVGGVVDEASIVRQLCQALDGSPDVICLSAGTYTRHNIPPKAFTAFWESRLRHHKGVAVIAAAGNNGDREPFWPAAFPWAVSVGALSRDATRRPEWSNHGGWVDVYAPGEDIVNAFPNGTYVDLDKNKREFTDKMARWSGTSFSTPIVAGMVARRIAETGENGWQAARSLRRLAKENFVAGLGPRLPL